MIWKEGRWQNCDNAQGIITQIFMRAGRAHMTWLCYSHMGREGLVSISKFLLQNHVSAHRVRNDLFLRRARGDSGSPELHHVNLRRYQCTSPLRFILSAIFYR
jgi:hypothetical protein